MMLVARRAAATHRGLSTVAVTGASGYIGSYVVAELLARGHSVRAAVRGCDANPAKAAHLLALPGGDRVTLIDGGDLSVDGSFDEAFAGADASNVLRSVDRAPTVQRFIHTSSIAAIQRYDKGAGHVFSEADFNDWSTIENGDAYGYGKTRGEIIARAHFAEGDQSRNEGANFVDVRDVAAAHATALEKAEELDGMRFVLVNDHPCMNILGLGAAAAASFPDYDLRSVPLLPPWKLSLAMAASHLPVVGKYAMTEFQRLLMTTPIH
ncbi:hypothetical protein JL721_3576 [Aureococcus anophagefferens]|nr:hypothetical protein JL721_3576 [Aureococcus anophagefferens]